ncbi:hypothetical protein V8C86DRAFT_2524533 [Haematococcus lacustris]
MAQRRMEPWTGSRVAARMHRARVCRARDSDLLAWQPTKPLLLDKPARPPARPQTAKPGQAIENTPIVQHTNEPVSFSQEEGTVTPHHQLQRPHQKTSPPHASPPAPLSSAKPAGPPEHVLGVDYGAVWTGLAVGNQGRRTELRGVRPDRMARAAFARQVLDLALQLGVQALVVGLPLDPHNLDSTLSNPDADTPHARRCRHFAHTLALIARPHGLHVYLYDEAHTSADAKRIAGLRGIAGMQGHSGQRQVKQLDSLSASLLLQRYFDRPGRAVRVVVRGSEQAELNGGASD